jgi:Transposase DDE domain
MANIPHWRRQLNSGLLVDPSVRDVLSCRGIEEHARESGHRCRESFWSPGMTLLAFLLQVLSAEKTLRAAVASLLAQLAARGEKGLPSSDPSAYCQARRRLPASCVERPTRALAERMQDLVGPEHRWHGHRLQIVDGSTVSMPDTPALQKAFPQPSAQRRGCGFPIARLVVLFCWATGAVAQVALGNLHIAEVTLFRKNWDEWLAPGDVVVADRHYCSYGDIVRLRQRGVFCLFRLHHRREADFRKGRRLGRHDRLVTWSRPKRWFPSFGISREEFEQLPETLAVRQIRITHVPKGFRSQTIVVVTTLLDAKAYPADEIRALFRDRWTAELNLRSLKTHLGMEILHGQSPDVVRKEIAMHLLAYNLIRLLMWQAAREHGRDLHRLSFTGTLHRLRRVLPLAMLCSSGRNVRTVALRDWLLQWIADDELPDRPDRVEPRRKKRRPKEYSLLSKPRSWYHLHGDTDAR